MLCVGGVGWTEKGNSKTTRKQEAPVNVVKAEVIPAEGFSGQSFNFKAVTDGPAKKVILIIGGNEYEMKGSGIDWYLTREIIKTGAFEFSMVALYESLPLKGTFHVKKFPEQYAKNEEGTLTNLETGNILKRFKDNGDGTVTDLLTGLMWTKSLPKNDAMNFEEATEYVRNLDFANHSDWRLPTRREWEALIDNTQKAPALPKGHPFEILKNMVCWSKDIRGARAYAANLYLGKTAMQGKKNLFFILPVRDAAEDQE